MLKQGTDKTVERGGIQTVSHSSILEIKMTKLEIVRYWGSTMGFVTLDLRCCFQSNMGKYVFP